jgi:Tol biopolymer transport system component
MAATLIACCALATGWMPDSSQWFFFTFADNEDVLRLDLDTLEVTRITEDPGMDFAPHVLADGASMFLTSNREQETEQVFRYNFRDGEMRQLTQNGAADGNPFGDAEHFYAHVNDGDDYDLAVFHHTGYLHHWLVQRPGDQFSPMGSPDNSLVVYVDRSPEAEDLWLYDHETEAVRRLTTSEDRSEFHPSWFPDSDRVAFVSHEDGRFRIESIAVDGSDRQMHFDDPAYTAFSPQVSPNGRWLAFVRYKDVAEGEDEEASVVLLPLVAGAHMEIIPVPDFEEVEARARTTLGVSDRTLDRLLSADGLRRTDI